MAIHIRYGAGWQRCRCGLVDYARTGRRLVLRHRGEGWCQGLLSSYWPSGARSSAGSPKRKPARQRASGSRRSFRAFVTSTPPRLLEALRDPQTPESQRPTATTSWPGGRPLLGFRLRDGRLVTHSPRGNRDGATHSRYASCRADRTSRPRLRTRSNSAGRPPPHALKPGRPACARRATPTALPGG